MQIRSFLSVATASLAAAALSGCASFSADGGFDAVRGAVQARLPAMPAVEVPWPRTPAERADAEARVQRLLAAPLSADGAAQVALLAHPALQAAYAELGVAEADLVQAGRWPNPRLTFARSHGGGEVQSDLGLHLGLGELLAMPWLREQQAQQRAAVQQAAAAQALAHAAQARRAWIGAVAAGELRGQAERALEAADVAATLAGRMAQAGNWSPLQRLREQAWRAEAAVALTRAQGAERSARERLVRSLGLPAEPPALQLPARLPEPPAQPREGRALEATAIARRLDVQAARALVAQREAERDTARGLGWVRALEAGVTTERTTGEATKRGWELAIELPLFDGGATRLARAEARHRQAEQLAAAAEAEARSQVREALAGYLAAWEVARQHREQVLPLAQAISEQNLLRYNGMLIGVFELLADARAQAAAQAAAIEALRDLWLAEVDLDLALVTRAEPAAAAGRGSAAAPAAPAADRH